MLGLAYGAIGTAIAIGIALYRYHTVRLPPVALYPGAILNAIATAFFDEAVFRGLLFGFLLTAGLQPNLANLIQALVYALATRLGAPGRPWYMLVTAARDRPRRRLADRDHGRHRRRVPGPLDHAGRDLPHDRPRRHPEGQGHRERGGRPAAGDAQGLAGARFRRGVPRPVARRPSPRTGMSSSRGRRSRSTSTCRSASRCARTATSSSTRGPRRADRGPASRPSSARC